MRRAALLPGGRILRTRRKAPPAPAAAPPVPSDGDIHGAPDLRFSFVAHRINARFTQIANKLLKTQGVSMYDSRILLFLLNRQEMRVGELVEAMSLPQSTMSHQLKQLQARRLIRRRRSRRDNRSVVVTLTPIGELMAKASEHYSFEVQRRIVESFGPAEVRQLNSLLQRLFDILDVSSFSPDPADIEAAVAAHAGNRRSLKEARGTRRRRQLSLDERSAAIEDI